MSGKEMLRRPSAFYGFLLGALALTTLAGCAASNERQEITGEVNLKGKPVEEGFIHFHPVDNQPTGDGALIVKGRYKIPKEKGLLPGKYKVTIIAGNGLSGEGDASPDSPNAGKKQAKERIPPEYNKNSNVVKEITKEGPNEFNFNIP
jgi:hypothetical protein